MYAHKPVNGRIELPLSEVLYEKIKDFNINGRFKSCDWLEDYLRLEKKAVYSDGPTRKFFISSRKSKRNQRLFKSQESNLAKINNKIYQVWKYARAGIKY